MLERLIFLVLHPLGQSGTAEAEIVRKFKIRRVWVEGRRLAPLFREFLLELLVVFPPGDLGGVFFDDRLSLFFWLGLFHFFCCPIFLLDTRLLGHARLELFVSLVLQLS